MLSALKKFDTSAYESRRVGLLGMCYQGMKQNTEIKGADLCADELIYRIV